MLGRRPAFSGLLLLADIVAIGAALMLGYYLRFGNLRISSRMGGGSAHVILGLSVLLAFLVGLALLRLYDPRRLLARGRVLSQLVLVGALAALTVGAVVFITQQKQASRFVYAVVVGGSTLALWLIRLAAVELLTWGGRRAPFRLLVVGTGEVAQRLASLAEQDPGAGTQIVGFISADEPTPVVDPGRIVGSLSELPRIIDEQIVDHVAFAGPGELLLLAQPYVLSCQDVGLDVSIVGPAFGRPFTRMDVTRVADMPALFLRASPQFRAAMFVKRVLDIALSLGLLLLTAPLILLSSLAIVLTSPGGVFYVQERVGLNGRLFRFYKLRTMVDGADRLQTDMQHLNEQDGPAFKIKRDPRATRVGSVLRQLSIDELPQLFNVLRGEMSLVGPRPPLASEVARYDRWQRRRLSMRPGLTCLWQVSGRNQLSFADWMRLDLEYIDRWSLWLDFTILLRTIPAVLSRRGAS